MKTRVLAFAMCVPIMGCATGEPPMTFSRINGACAAESTGFDGYATCLDDALADPRLPAIARTHARTQLYLAYVKALAARVRAGRMTHDEAATTASLTLKQMQYAERTENTQSLQQYLRAMRPAQGIVCTQVVPGMVKCE